jgi:putative DNA primase/helicase
MLRVKGNIAKKVGGLAYEIKAKTVVVEGTPEYQPYVEWLGQTEKSASDILIGGKPVGRPAEQVKDAQQWLATFLAKGSEAASDVRRFGSKAGHSWATLRRAKDDLGVISTKQGNQSWDWRLPTETGRRIVESSQEPTTWTRSTS